MSPEARKRLAAREAAVVAALTEGGPPPPGFEPKALEIAAKVVAKKIERVGRKRSRGFSLFPAKR